MSFRFWIWGSLGEGKCSIFISGFISSFGNETALFFILLRQDKVFFSSILIGKKMSAFVVFVTDNLSGLFVYCFLGIFDMEEKLSLNGG